MRKLIQFLIVCFLCTFSYNSFGQNAVGWPKTTNVSKPWTRWWWMGSSVDEQNLSKALETYSKAGLGGMEITPIYGVKGMENQFIPYTSPKWMKMLSYTLSEAKRLDLGIDMALASGWPFGGPWVSPDEACKYLEFKTYKLNGGTLREKIEFTEKPLVRAVSKSLPIEQIKDPIASNDSLYIYAFDQVRFARKLPFVTIMAYSITGDVLDLTDKVDKDGTLNWQAPTKDWTLIAAFSAWHGKQVERAGPGGEGDVIDHFSSEVLLKYLSHFDESFKGNDISGLRAFFNDSYEVDDAQGESFYTPTFFAEFQKRRGYDLRLYLPALLGQTTEIESLRVLCDYRETLSDLLLDNYTIPWQKWSQNKGKIIRNQPHGSPANILDLYAASDIPETEGTDLMNIKFASSAAHVSGKKLVSAEAATWLNEHFLGTISQTKENVDRYLIGGVNHIVYHGTTYSPEGELWPGRMFYAAEHFAPTNPFWKDFPTLNQYVTRTQSFLQQGVADNDVLLYFPIYDQWMEKGKSWLHHFHGADINSTTYAVASDLNKKGYTFDFVSDKQIGKLSFSKGKLVSEGNAAYKTILVPKLKYIPLQTFRNLISLAEKGAKVTFNGEIPTDVPGFANYLENLKELTLLKENLKLLSDENGTKKYSVGKGQIIIDADCSKSLNYAGVHNEQLADKNLEFIRLSDGKTKTYFISNWSGKSIDEWVTFQSKATTVVQYNPMTGEFGKLVAKPEKESGTGVHLKLKNGESCILQFWDKPIKVANYNLWKETGIPVAISSKWNIQFIDGGPVLPDSLKNVELGSWTAFNENTKNFSGSAIFSCEFLNPGISCDAYKLELGEVCESASIKLNGKELGTLIGPDFSLIIDKKLIQKNNTLEICVTNLMSNRIEYMDKNEIPYRKFYNTNFNAKFKENQGIDGKFTAKNWEPRKSGLIGPVSLKPLIKE